jgi:nucleotide-binding universal stress UspA family protein
LALASLFDARIALLQAVYPVTIMTDPAMSFPTGFDQELTALERQQAQDYLDGVAEQLIEAGVQASGTAVLGGAAYKAIADAAHQEDTDMVALTTHGRSGLRRMLLGSVADKLVRGGGWPVLVTRPPKKDR